jgi:DNA-binding CsgD family transcriptional regulator
MFIAGEPGSGKSALLDLARRQSASAFRVGWGQADPVETPVAFGVFGQVFRSLGSLDVSLPTSRTESLQLALTLLESLSRERPVLIILDDLHTADPESLALLAFLWRRMESMRVGLLGGFRLWPPAAVEVIRRLPGATLATLRTPRLDRRAVVALLESGTRRVSTPDEVNLAMEQTQGNPLLVQQLVLHRRHGGPIDDRVESWRQSDLRDLMSRFVGDTDEARKVASAASIFGDHFRPALALRASGLDADAARSGVEALFQSGLFQPIDRGGARFTFPLLRRVVYSAMSPTMRARMHASAMRALLDHGVAPSEAAEHAMLAEAAGDAGAVEVLAEAGQAALAGGDLSRARRYLEGGVAMAANGARPRLKFLLGQVLLAGGEHAAALSLFNALRRSRSVNGEGPLSHRWAARALFVGGNPAEADKELEAAERNAERAADPDSLARVRIDRAAMAFFTKGPAAAEELARSVQTSHPKLATAASALAACAAYQAGDTSGLPLVASLTRELTRNPVDDVGPLLWSSGVLGICQLTAQNAEMLTESEAAFTALFETARRLQLPAPIAALSTARAEYLCQAGQIDAALTMAEVAVTASERARGLAAWADAVRADVLFESGQLAAAAERLHRAQDLNVKQGAPPMQSAFLLHLEAMWEHDAAHPLVASELFERVEHLVKSAGVLDPAFIPWATPAIGAHASIGRLEAAKRVLDWVERGVTAFGTRRSQAMAAIGHARIAEAEGDLVAAEAAYGQALGILERGPMRLQEIKTLVAQGRVLRMLGHVRGARAPLVRAVELAGAAGAGRIEGLARQEMAISGGRFRQHRDPSHLTPQETRVAALARLGLSDRDIGRRLFISQKTVETHLMRVYRKLEVNNRRELMLRR